MTRWLAWTSALLASIFIFECSMLTWHVWYVAKRESEPERIIHRVQSVWLDNYPQLKQAWLENARQQSPQIAERFSEELIAQAPRLRQRLEAASLRELEQGIDNAVELSADEFRQWLRDNHAAIEDAFIQVEQAPHEARMLVLDTEASLEEQVGLDLRDQAKLTLEVYRIFNDKLERLANPDEEFTRQEKLERRAIRILRALTKCSLKSLECCGKATAFEPALAVRRKKHFKTSTCRITAFKIEWLHKKR